MISKTWIKKLFKEISLWTQEGIIRPEQADRIKQKYSEALAYNRLVSTIFILGSVLIGLGIILFVASNWQYIGRPFKIGLIFCCILAFNMTGYYFRFEKGKFPKLGEALLFIGAISFGAGIWLIAQIFNIQYNYANGLLYWMIGILPAVFLLRSQSILILSSLLLPIWLGVAIADDYHKIVYSFFILQAVILYFTYREKQKAALIISIIATGIWLTHYFYLRLEGTGQLAVNIHLLYTNLFIAYGFILYYLGMWHYRNNNFASFSIIYKLFGIVFIFINNYSLTFVQHYKEFYDMVGQQAKSVYMPADALTVYLFYLLAGMLFLNFIFKLKSEENLKEAQAVLAFLFIQVIAMHLWPFSDKIISASYNIVLFTEIVTFLYLSYLLNEEYIFRLSLYIFALDVLTRYFDAFWKILPRSVFFMIGGAILVFGGIYMEKKRKSIEEKMKNKPTGQTV